MTNPLTFINGEPGDCLSSHDRGLAYGHGLFETMRLGGGIIPLLEMHLDRLADGARRLNIPMDRASLMANLAALLPRIPGDGVVKLMLTAGRGPRGYRAAPSATPNLIVHWFPAPVLATEVILQPCRYRLPDNPALAGVKHLNRLDQVLAASELQPQREGLLMDGRHQVVEALSHNIFVWRRGRWLTPPLDRCGVAGVMRRYLLESLLPALGEAWVEDVLPVGDLAEVEEMFVCNAVAGIVPVTKVEGVATWPVQPRGDRLRRALEERLPCFAA